MPTASEEELGLQRWGAGVSAVVVYSHSPLVVGVPVNKNYIKGGWVSKPLFVQPFYNYNFEHDILNKFFISASGEFQADWERSNDRTPRSISSRCQQFGKGRSPRRSAYFGGSPPH